MLLLIASGVSAAIYTLKNNVQVEGEPGKIGGIGETPLASGTTAGEVSTKLVHFADDGIRRTFFSQYQVLNFVNSPPESLERIMLKFKNYYTFENISEKSSFFCSHRV